MNWEAMAVVGRIARPHGIRGQVVVDLETDFPDERFRVGSELVASQPGGQPPRAMTITSARFPPGHPHRAVVGLSGVNDMNAAQLFAGAELRVPADRLAPLPSGTFYHHDLIGCQVETVEGERVGVVAGVEGHAPGGSRLVVTREQGEALVPLVAEICRLVDPIGRRVVIAPPEGLLDLNTRR